MSAYAPTGSQPTGSSSSSTQTGSVNLVGVNSGQSNSSISGSITTGSTTPPPLITGNPMAKFLSSSALDSVLTYMKTTITKQILVSAYTIGDSYATVQANKLAEVAMASTDFTIASSGNNRTLTTAAGKTATTTAASTGTDLHLVFTDGVGAVIWVTDETTNQVFQSGQTVSFPVITHTDSQPT